MLDTPWARDIACCYGTVDSEKNISIFSGDSAAEAFHLKFAGNTSMKDLVGQSLWHLRPQENAACDRSASV